MKVSDVRDSDPTPSDTEGFADGMSADDLATEPAPPGRPGLLRRAWTRVRALLRVEGVPVLIGFAAVIVGLAVVYDIWQVHPRVPVGYGGDTTLSLSVIRNIQLH